MVAEYEVLIFLKPGSHQVVRVARFVQKDPKDEDSEFGSFVFWVHCLLGPLSFGSFVFWVLLHYLNDPNGQV